MVKLKPVLIILVVLLILVFAIPFIGGFVSSLNTKEAVENGKKNAKYSNLFVPEGYRIERLAEWDQESDIFLTKMTKGDRELVLLQAPENNEACRGKTIMSGDVPLCTFAKGDVPELVNYEVYSWHSSDAFFQVHENDERISIQEIQQIIASL